MSLRSRGTLLAASLVALSLPVAASAADFAACFTLDPAVAWTTGPDTIQNSEATFGGEPAVAVVTSGGGLSRAQVRDASGRSLLAVLHYGIAAWGGDPSQPRMTDTFDPAPSFPATATPGQKFSLTGTGTRENHAEETEAAIEYDGFSDYTFVGFEDLVVDIAGSPRTFAQTCHLRADVEGGRVEEWYAAGFGRIKFVRYSGDSVLFSDEIETIASE